MSEIKELANIFAKVDDPELMEVFLVEIFTPREIRDISLRWDLLKMVKDKTPQREIASQLGISLCKITRGAKIIKDESSVTNRILDGKLDE